MWHLTTHDLASALALYGYWAVLVFVFVQSAGIPFPGETMLLVASVYAGTTHRLAIAPIIVAAAAGTVAGFALAYLVGRAGGYPLLRRYGRLIRLDERRLAGAHGLFERYGGAIVFWGHFNATLRVVAAVLAGANRMSWPRFACYNVAGGIAWAVLFGLAGYLFGGIVLRIGGVVGVAALVLAALGAGATVVALRRRDARTKSG